MAPPGSSRRCSSAGAGPLGPMLSARRDELEERGLIGPGQTDEELLIVAGRA